jgi:DNA transformation protein
VDAARIAEVFETFGPIRTRRMFGGTGIYADGVIFAVEADGTLYLKADAALAAQLAAEGSAPFTYQGKGRTVTMSYWQLPDGALDDPDEAARWARSALAVAQAAPR